MKSWLLILVLVAAASAGGYVFGRRSARPDGPVATTAAEPVGAEGPAASSGLVVLDEAMLEAANVKVETVSRRPIQIRRQIPGRLQYNDHRHVAVKVVTDGILTESFVRPGDRVVSGQPLATVSSSEIGTARADVLQRTADVELARKKLEWAEQIGANISKLAARIRERGDLDALEKEFQNAALGDAREKLLATYVKFSLTNSLNASLKEMGDSGALSTRTIRERQSELQVARQSLDAVTEQVEFQSQIDVRSATAALQDAERRRDIAKRHLSTMLGTASKAMRVARKPDGTTQPDSLDVNDLTGDLSVMTLRAPFEGTIEKRLLAVTERVKQGDTVFVLADTSSLWVSADIREQDWSAVALVPGAQLEVQLPAMPGCRLTAEVEWVGREVQEETNAIPLIARLPNVDGLLRPGMFARVAFPVGEARSVIAVPDSALIEHEGKRFVFIAETSERFRRCDVTTGSADGDWTEILTGLKGGERVVTSGVFALKSALLLEAETEGA